MTLKEYLSINNETIAQFSRRSLLSFCTVLKIVRGEKARIDSAKKVVRATKKDVTLKDLGHGS